MKTAVKRLLRPVSDYVDYWRLPGAVRQAISSDARGVASHDPGPQAAIIECLGWLKRAQDASTTHDGGVARHFDLRSGWGPSYPETTGYIVPTFIAQASLRAEPELRSRAQRMLDWFVSIQLAEGGFQGGTVLHEPRVPVTFNTGQILLGLSAGVAEFGDAYRSAMTKAADWLAGSLDPDGCWRRHRTPYASPDDKAYETHVSWGLFEAARLDPERGWQNAAERQVRWALTRQLRNGWMQSCCLDDPQRPLTHTLGYALRGILEAWRFSGSEAFMDAGVRLADGLLSALRPNGALPGRLDREWSPAAEWVCLTGNVQVAHCWLMLFVATGDPKYRDAGRLANAYVRRTIRYGGSPQTRGAVRGSFPIDGGYGTFQFLNWAAKFCIDSNQLELDVG